MIEPNNKFESNNSLNLLNKCYIESNINKNPDSIFQDELTKRSNYNFDCSNCSLNSKNSILIKSKDNISLNNLNTDKSINDEKKMKDSKNDIKYIDNNIDAIDKMKLIYHKKSVNNICNISKNIKSNILLNKFNNINYKINDNDKNKNNDINLNSSKHFNPISNMIQKNENNRKLNFNDITLNEYLKEEIKKMSCNTNCNNINNNSEDTKVNTLDLNSYYITETPNAYNSYRDYSHKNNHLINYKNNKFSTKTNNKNLKKKLSYNGINININKQKMNKKTEIKKNLIKKIEFFCPNYNNLNDKKFLTLNNKSINRNTSYRFPKKDNFPKKILNISFNYKSLNNKNKSEKKKYFSNLNSITNNFLNSNKKRKNINCKKDKKKCNSNNYKTIKKIKIKKIDILYSARNDINEKKLLNLKNDLDNLIKENNIIKEKTNKKFRFCKSKKKDIYKNININEFTKDFLIVPKQYININNN